MIILKIKKLGEKIKNFAINKPILWKLWRTYKGRIKSKGNEKGPVGTLFFRFKGLEYIFSKCSGCSVLDIGCYEGMVCYELAKNNCSLVHGFDIDKPAIEFANRLFRRIPVESKFIQTDFAITHNKLDKKYSNFILKEYDIVILLAVYHHLKYQISKKDLNNFVIYLLQKCKKWFIISTHLIPEIENIILDNNFELVHSLQRCNDSLEEFLKIYMRNNNRKNE